MYVVVLMQTGNKYTFVSFYSGLCNNYFYYPAPTSQSVYRILHRDAHYAYLITETLICGFGNSLIQLPFVDSLYCELSRCWISHFVVQVYQYLFPVCNVCDLLFQPLLTSWESNYHIWEYCNFSIRFRSPIWQMRWYLGLCDSLFCVSEPHITPSPTSVLENWIQATQLFCKSSVVNGGGEWVCGCVGCGGRGVCEA